MISKTVRWDWIFCLFAGFSLLTPFTALADWGSYRGDHRRSGVSPENLKMPLVEQWVHEATLPPQPAWPELPATRDVFRGVRLGPTVVFDRAFHVVVHDRRLYFGSSADDHVYCLDAETGELMWSFCTEGPIRLAPTVIDGRVYAASDDGCVYCLDGAQGTLIWRHRIGPSDRRLPGNGRMISLWPVRCGIVVDDKTVFACAGLFPSQGTYLCALDAENGQTIWKQRVDISAQGYLVASPTRLFVPTGRTPPHIYDRKTGEQIAAFAGRGQQRSGSQEGGGTFAVLVDDALLHGGGEKGGIQITDPKTRDKIVWTPGLRAVIRGPIAYILKERRLQALDRGVYVEFMRLKQKKEKTQADKTRFAELTSRRTAWVKWDISCPPGYELILSGETVIVGQKDQVTAYAASDGSQVWLKPVDGKAYSLAVSDGSLFVATDKGRIHCFAHGEDDTNVRRTSDPQPVVAQSPYPEDQWSSVYRRAAKTIVDKAGTTQGYCLVLDADTGRLAHEIAKASQLRVIGVEADPGKVAIARQLLTKAGVYGKRIVIHQSNGEPLPYQSRFANVITSDGVLLGRPVSATAKEVCRLLRPAGGTVVLVASPSVAKSDPFEGWASDVISGWTSQQNDEDGLVGMVERGPLPGAHDWTHFYADIGNTACSGDELPPGAVDIQWFGRPGPKRMVDRHEKSSSPLYKNGRMFVSGDNYLVAMDAYNGTVLWERNVPNSIRLGAFKHSGNMVVTNEYLYVAAADRCLGLDTATGQERLVLKIPEPCQTPKCEWGYLGSVGDQILGSVTKPIAAFRDQDVPTQTLIWRDHQVVVCSDAFFALDRHTGTPRWQYTPKHGVILNSTIAVGAGRVFLVESTNPDTCKDVDGRITLDQLLGNGSALVALDLLTGKVAWRQAVDFSAMQHIIYLSYAEDTVLVTGSKNVELEAGQRLRYDLLAFSAAHGDLLWKSTQKPIPDHILNGPHGEQVQHSAIVDGKIYNTGFALDLHSGDPVPGWKWQKSDKCGVVTMSARCAFSRYSNPRMFDLKSGKYTELTSVTRPGCWVNILPAGGLILIPEASSGCTCDYSIQTSIALTPRAESPQ